jgi:hypothetical protein
VYNPVFAVLATAYRIDEATIPAYVQWQGQKYNQKGGMPLARLQLKLPAREGEVKYLNQWEKK